MGLRHLSLWALLFCQCRVSDFNTDGIIIFQLTAACPTFWLPDFNTGIYFHLPPNSINPYLGIRKIFIFHLTGELDLNAGVVGFEIENYFVEAGIGFGQEKTDFGNTQTELAILQIGWLF